VFAAWHAKKRADREAKRAAELEERKKKVGRTAEIGQSAAIGGCLVLLLLLCCGCIRSCALADDLATWLLQGLYQCCTYDTTAVDAVLLPAHCCVPSAGLLALLPHACCACCCCGVLQGLLNGREIFLSDNFVALDDANAGGDDEYRREDDEEARINDMFEQVRWEQRCCCACQCILHVCCVYGSCVWPPGR
jgi:hypothetical protein